MKLRLAEKNNGKYIIQKRFCFIWFNCTKNGEVDSLFVEGYVQEYYNQATAKEHAKYLINKNKTDKAFDKKFYKENKIIKTHNIED